MNTYENLLQHLAELFLESETFQTNFAEKIEMQILYSRTFSQKSCHL
jgi:hypothetical protein